MYMLTAFFISFLLILVDNSLVNDNVGNQSHYNQNGRTAQDGIVVNIAGKMNMQPGLQLLLRLISIPDFLISLSCVCILIRLLYSFVFLSQRKHNSLTSEIIFCKKSIF